LIPEQASHLGPATVVVVVLLAVSTGWLEGTGSVANAAPCPAIPRLGEISPRLMDLSPEVRLAWIDDHLFPVARRARLWAWGWGGGIGAAGVANLAVVPFVRPQDRIDWYVGAASSAVGVIPLWLFPLAVVRDARELHERNAHLPSPAEPSDDGGGICARLADAETRLVRDAEDQAAQQRWWVHAGNVAFNTGVLLFLGLGYQHWLSGIINGAAGVLVGEALILTQPTQTIDDLATYRQGGLFGPPGATVAAPPLGLGYRLAFP